MEVSLARIRVALGFDGQLRLSRARALDQSNVVDMDIESNSTPMIVKQSSVAWLQSRLPNSAPDSERNWDAARASFSAELAFYRHTGNGMRMRSDGCAVPCAIFVGDDAPLLTNSRYHMLKCP
jgi:hypothetical protein